MISTRTLCLLIAMAATAGSAQAKTFGGFDDHFNLGLSKASGAVCEASRDFDDPLVGDHVRAWDVSCRGWSQRLGRIYILEDAKPSAPPKAWLSALGARAACDFAKATPLADNPSTQQIACKSDKLDYVVLTASSHGRMIAAEGMAPIADVLATGVRYVSGAIPEPAVVAEQTASVGSAASASANALALADQTSDQSADSRRQEAYESNAQWKFDEAEAIFAELASAEGGATSPAVRAESLYNFALNVSNKGRFAEADVYFAQADAFARQAGLEGELGSLALNYRAAHARNQRRYDDAIKLAEQAIKVRRSTAPEGVASQDASGAIRISDVTSAAATARLTAAQRNDLRDVQAIQIEATSQEALGHTDQARETLRRAVALLEQPLFPAAGEQSERLGEASPWLNTRVRADVLRLDRNVGRAAESMPDLEKAIATFSKKHPGSLPLGAFLVELARAEAAAGQDDKALGDYEAAFEIFRKERGSLGPSADLVGTYFDILLRRIGDAPAQHQQDVARFFEAAQTLVEQSSAEAAKRQAASIKSSDTAAAGLARALDDTNRLIEAKKADIRALQQQTGEHGDEAKKANADLAGLVEQDRSLELQLEQANPGYASALRSLVTLDELKKALKPGEVYVKVFMLANRGYGVAITPTSARPYGVELSREAAQGMVDNLRKPIDKPHVNADGTTSLGRYDVPLAHDAFVKLFGPVQPDLLAAKLIVYEPDATLIGAPIAALAVEDGSAVMKRNIDKARAAHTPVSYAGVAWLGARVASSIALSPSAFVQVRAAAASKAQEPFYGFGDPEIGSDPRAFARVKASSLLTSSAVDFCDNLRQSLLRLSPLPQTADEVKVVAASFGQDASKYSLGGAFTDTDLLARQDLSQYRVLYFATHGVLPPSDYQECMKPALVTSLGGGSSDGLLDVDQIWKLSLNADVVVLSACDTGRSSGGGEALGGLVATFVEAGARNVVVSNWSVDSLATERLMTTMFADKGVSQAVALTKAEQTMMASPDQYSHPFYWAAFTVVGDGARAMPAS